MTKFKVGDKVRLIYSNEVGVILDADNPKKIKVLWNAGCLNSYIRKYRESHLTIAENVK